MSFGSIIVILSSIQILGLTVVLLTGCMATPQKNYRQIMQDAAMVNRQDGVSQEEAILLAQNMIVKRGRADQLYSLKPFKVHKRLVWDKGDEEIEFVIPPREFAHALEESWRVLFKDRQGSFFHGLYPIMPFYVDIDAKSGEVLRWGLLK